MASKICLLAVMGALAAIWFASGETNPVAAEPSSVKPSAAYTHENLSVFILRGPETFDASKVLTLQEALERGVAVVHETGSVNTLAIENTSDTHEVFVQSGEIVKGGKQDRLIASDMLLPMKSGKVSIASNCCEQSRWTARGGESVGKFDKSTDFAVGNPIRVANDGKMQGEVWRNVAVTQQALNANLQTIVTANASPTSLQLALEDKTLGEKVAAYEKTLGGLAARYPDAVGVVIAVNGQVIAADQYGSNALFRKLWPKLLKAASVDAIARKTTEVAAVPSVGEVEKFLASTATPAAKGDVLSNSPRELNRMSLNPDVIAEVESLQVAAPLGTLVNTGNIRLNRIVEEPHPVQGGIAVNETKATSQPGKSIHKSILKK